MLMVALLLLLFVFFCRVKEMAFKACCSNARCLCSHATEINFLGINYPTSERVPGPPQHDKPDEKPSTRLVKIKPLGGLYLVHAYIISIRQGSTLAEVTRET